MMARRTGEVPDALCCPISMEIMRDPVIAADGHTYERAEIEASRTTARRPRPAPSSRTVL